MKKIKEFFSEFFESKFNIVLTIFVALLLLIFLLSQFIYVLSLPCVILLAINCFLIGIKFCMSSKKVARQNRRYSVFLDDGADENVEVQEPKGNKNFVVIGVFLIIVAVYLCYTFIKLIA